MSSTREAIRHLEQSVAQHQRESRASRPTDALWEEFAIFRKAISMALLKEPIIGIEGLIFLGTRPKIDGYIQKNGRKLNSDIGGVKLDLKVKTGSSRDPSKTRIDIAGTCAINGHNGFVKIIATENMQVEGFWLKNDEGSYPLEQVVKDAEVFVPNKLATTDNKNHVVVPNTDERIRFLKRIVDINKQADEICC